MGVSNLMKGTRQTGEVGRLHKIIEQQQQEIDDMRAAKFKLKLGRRKKVGKKTFMRVIAPDSHGSHIDQQAASAFLNDLELLKPRQVVMLGDHLDCGGFLAQHFALGFVAETRASFADDVAAANQFLDAIQERTGNVETYYLEGNHEARIEKWIIKQTLRNPADAQMFYDMFGVESVLNLKQRKINFVKRSGTYHNLSKRGMIKLGKCVFQHGTRCGINAAQATLNDIGNSVVFGHTHRVSSQVKDTLTGTIGAWSVGCLCELAPLYADTRITGWSHAYGLQIVEQDGTFLHLTIPILQGRSMLSHLLKAGL